MFNRGGAVEKFVTLYQKVKAARKLLEDLYKYEYSKKWDTRYINSLPSAAFAVVEKGYSEGKDKRGRHLPHHSDGVKSSMENSTVDLAHYRNALARVNQIESVYGKESDSSLIKRAASHLEKHRAVLQTSKSNFNVVELHLWEESEILFEEKVKPLLKEDGNT